jgi:integrase
MGGKKRANGEGSIFKRPNGTWTGQITIGTDPETGKLKRMSFSGKTRKEVKDKMTAAMADMQRGTFVEPNDLTIEQWLNMWLYDYMKPHLRPSTWSSYEMIIRLYITPRIGTIFLKNLQPEQLQLFYNDLLESGRADGKGGLSNKTVREVHSVIHGALKQAVKNNLVIRNAAEATAPPRKIKHEMQTIDADQVVQFLNCARNDRLYAAFLLEFNTGIRRGELLGLQWKDVDLETGTISICRSLVRIYNKGKTELSFQEPKTAAAKRTLPITAEVVAALKNHKKQQIEERLAFGSEYEDNDLVFCSPKGTPLDPRSFTRHFDTLLNKAGLPHIRFHDARHTVATLLLEQNEHPRVVQELLGHSDISTTLGTYSHVSSDLKRKAAEKLSAVLAQNKQKTGQ